MAVFEALARVLATRFLLFLSLCGAFVLALQAMQQQTQLGVVILGVYSMLTIGPFVVLEVRGKPLRSSS